MEVSESDNHYTLLRYGIYGCIRFYSSGTVFTAIHFLYYGYGFYGLYGLDCMYGLYGLWTVWILWIWIYGLYYGYAKVFVPDKSFKPSVI